MKLRCTAITSFEQKVLCRNPKGEKIFVKIFSSSLKDKTSAILTGLKREKTCLKVLKGLAVPQIINLNSKKLPKYPGQQSIHFIAQSFVGGKSAHDLKLKPFELVGVWIFFLEQLAAFRKRKIIYTDFKCGNIMGRRSPLRITIIDFDYAFKLTAGMRKLHCHGFTPGFESPESMRGDIGTEKSLVYECALILFHFLTNLDHKDLDHPSRGLGYATNILQQMGAHNIANVLHRCLDKIPSKRPKNYGTAFQMINLKLLPIKIKKTWTKLREPYINQLEKIKA